MGRVWGVGYPDVVFDLVGYALEHGAVTQADAAALLRPYRNKTKAEGYLNLGLQGGLLREPSGDYRARYGGFVPTERGRRLYVAADENKDAAVRELLGSMPYYRFHTELLLAGLILENSIRAAPQAAGVLNVVKQEVPWFLGDRLLWIQQAIGWRDSSTYQASDLGLLHGRVHALNALPNFVEASAYDAWDRRLGFVAGFSDLSRAQKLCRFLAEERQRPLYVGRQFVSRQALAVLLLLILAEGEGLAVDVHRWPDAANELLGYGIDIRLQHDRAYLFSAVKVILPVPAAIEELSLPDLDDNPLGVFNLTVAAAASALADDSAREVLSVDLGQVRHQIRNRPGTTPFTACALADDDDVITPSSVEIWHAQPLWDVTTDNFHDEVCQLYQAEATTRPSAAILLNRDSIAASRGADLTTALTDNPHLYVLLMLLIDRIQSGPAASQPGPVLVADTWWYRGHELVPMLDHLLQALGYSVWSEGYARRPEARASLGRELVDTLRDFHVAAVQWGQLELTGEFRAALERDQAALASQTKFIRQRLRQAAQANGSSAY